MFGLSNIRLGIYAALALLIAYLAWREHSLTRKVAAVTVEKTLAIRERDQSRTDFAAYKATAEADAKLNQETRRGLQIRLSEIERARADPPIRLRCVASARPAVPTEGGAAAGTDGQAAGREPEAIAFDPGPDLEQYAADCAAIAVKFEALQAWERARTH